MATKRRLAIRCTSQEQWDFVTEKLGYQWQNGKWDEYKTHTVIYTYEQMYGRLSRVGSHTTRISFWDWYQLYFEDTYNPVPYVDPRALAC